MDFQRRTPKSLFCPLSSVFFTTNLLKKLRTFAAVQTERGTKKVKIRESDFSLEFPPLEFMEEEQWKRKVSAMYIMDMKTIITIIMSRHQ